MRDLRRRRGVPDRRPSRSASPTSSGARASSTTRSALDAEGDRIVADLLARFRREARQPEARARDREGPDGPPPRDAPREGAGGDRAHGALGGDRGARAPRRAWRLARPGLFEYQLEAAIDSRFRNDGRERARVPHDRRVGRERDDPPLHREPPADRRGRPRPRRRGLRGGRLRVRRDADVSGVGAASRGRRGALYDAVLAAQRAAIAAVRPGAPWDAPHEAAREVLLDALPRPRAPPRAGARR